MAAASASVTIVGGQIVDGAGAEPVRDGLVLIEDSRVTHAGKRDGRARFLGVRPCWRQTAPP